MATELKVIQRDPLSDDYDPGPSWLNAADNEKTVEERRNAIHVVGTERGTLLSLCVPLSFLPHLEASLASEATMVDANDQGDLPQR